MVDASKGFIKDGNKNRLRAQDIHRVVDTFTRQLETPKYSRMVPLAEVEANDFNLNLPRYIDSTEPEDLQDIDGHLRGGIPMRDIDSLKRYWDVFPSVRHDLFVDADRPGYVHPKVEAAQVKAAIFSHPEFTAFNTQVAVREPGPDGQRGNLLWLARRQCIGGILAMVSSRVPVVATISRLLKTERS
jgi:type I restriction enzyme M protein